MELSTRPNSRRAFGVALLLRFVWLARPCPYAYLVVPVLSVSGEVLAKCPISISQSLPLARPVCISCAARAAAPTKVKADGPSKFQPGKFGFTLAANRRHHHEIRLNAIFKSQRSGTFPRMSCRERALFLGNSNTVSGLLKLEYSVWP